MRARQSGMTLVELLVGLALFGLIAVTSLAALRGGIRLWHGGESDGAAIARIETVHGTLRRQLEDAANLADAGGAAVAFAGGTRQMDWVGRPPAASMPPGLYALRLRLEEGRLLLGWREFDPAATLARQPPRESVVMLEGIAAARLAYFGPDVGWQESWSSARLPRLVRLHLEPVAGATWRWPPLVVAIGSPLDGT